MLLWICVLLHPAAEAIASMRTNVDLLDRPTCSIRPLCPKVFEDRPNLWAMLAKRRPGLRRSSGMAQPSEERGIHFP
jgi:hypothetical protein